MNIIEELTSKDDKSACAFSEKITSESKDSNAWYVHFDEFASLLNHPNSFVRNRVIWILSSLAKWDDENRFEKILPEYLSHITDEKPITSRQCVQALSQIGNAKPQFVPEIIAALQNADLSKYKDSMRPLIEKDIQKTMEKIEIKS